MIFFINISVHKALNTNYMPNIIYSEDGRPIYRENNFNAIILNALIDIYANRQTVLISGHTGP
jgi:hypothetical protein